MPKNLQLDLVHYIPSLLVSLSNKLSAGASKCYRKHFDVGIAEWRLLSMLAVENGITANRISQVTGVDKGLVSRSLQQLEEAKYVTISVDPRDARRYTVSLSAKGRELHDRIFHVAMERERRLLSGLSPEEVDVLANMLGRMHRQIDYVNEYDPDTH